jgi:hypothetical protein
MMRDDYFQVTFTIVEASSIFEEAGAVEKFGSSLKLNHHKQI